MKLYKKFSPITGIELNQDGGAVYVHTHSSADITDCMFSGNKAADDGGAIHIEIGKEIMISYSKFIKNVADDSGASIVIETCNASIVACIFQSESVSFGFGGSLCVLDGSDVTVTNSQFVNCTAHTGGSISVINVSNLKIEDSVILESMGNENAGALHVGHRSSLTAVGLSIQSSKSKFGGGIYCTEGGHITAHNCNFTSNIASSTHGGALYLSDCKAILDASIFDGNIAEKEGGAIFAQSASMKLNDIRGVENLAQDAGGFMFLTVHSDLHSNNLELIDNFGQSGNSIVVLKKSVVILEIASFYALPNVTHCLIVVNGSSQLIMHYKASDGTIEVPTQSISGRFKKSITRPDVCGDSSSRIEGIF